MRRYLYSIIGAALLMSLSCCKSNITGLIGDLGYSYDSAQDIYVSRVDSWQRKAGYSAFIDSAAVPTGMVIDCEPVIFDCSGKTYMIEFWKGQYDLSAGSEIGIYTKSDPGARTWECGQKKDMLDMAYSLKKGGKEVFNRNGRHWWLTGFKPGEFCNPWELTMDVSIAFHNHPEWLNPFIEGLRKVGYDSNSIKITGDTVNILFDRPKSKQPVTDSMFISMTQAKNKALVDQYNKVKKEMNIPDNSPKSIEKMLAEFPDLLTRCMIKAI